MNRLCQLLFFCCFLLVGCVTFKQERSSFESGGIDNYRYEIRYKWEIGGYEKSPQLPQESTKKSDKYYEVIDNNGSITKYPLGEIE